MEAQGARPVVVSEVLLDLLQLVRKEVAVDPVLLTSLPVIANLVAVQVLLSVDNALALAVGVSHLPHSMQRRALGYVTAFAFLTRGLAVCLVGWLIQFPMLKFLAAGFLIYLAWTELGPSAGESSQKQARSGGFWTTVGLMVFTDFTFSIDNLVAASGLCTDVRLACIGIFVSLAAMPFAVGFLASLMEKHPALRTGSYVLVGLVGVQLILGITCGIEVSGSTEFLIIAGVIGWSILHGRIWTAQKRWEQYVRRVSAAVREPERERFFEFDLVEPTGAADMVVEGTPTS